MELNDMASANILGYSIIIAVISGVLFYISTCFLVKKMKYKFLCTLVIIAVFGFGMDITWSHLAIQSAKQKLAELNSILEKGNELRLYNACYEKISDDIDLAELYISQPEILAKIRTLIDGSSLKVELYGGITEKASSIETASRFHFEIQKPDQITEFAIIGENILEIKSGNKLYRYESSNQKLYQNIKEILQDQVLNKYQPN